MSNETPITPEGWINAAKYALKDALLCEQVGNYGGAGSYSWEARGYLRLFEKMMAEKGGVPLRKDFDFG